MKNILTLMLAGIMIASLSSCITSIQPLVTNDSVITDNRVIGNWTHDNEVFKIEPFLGSEFARELDKLAMNRKGSMDLPAGDQKIDSVFYNKLYMVTFERNGATYYMGAGLIKLGNSLFMDLFPAAMYDTKVKDNLANPYSINYDYQGGFTVAKVYINSNQQLTLKFIDGSFVKEQILAGRMRLKHEKDQLFDTFIITASTNELRQFVEKYADDERVFSKDGTIVLTRKPGHL